jgi:glycine dehydrogenase
MIAIKAETDRVKSGEWEAANSPLTNAPHTQVDLLGWN